MLNSAAILSYNEGLVFGVRGSPRSGSAFRCCLLQFRWRCSLAPNPYHELSIASGIVRSIGSTGAGTRGFKNGRGIVALNLSQYVEAWGLDCVWYVELIMIAELFGWALGRRPWVALGMPDWGWKQAASQNSHSWRLLVGLGLNRKYALTKAARC